MVTNKWWTVFKTTLSINTVNCTALEVFQLDFLSFKLDIAEETNRLSVAFAALLYTET